MNRDVDVVRSMARAPARPRRPTEAPAREPHARLAREARQALARADTGVLHVDGLTSSATSNALLLENGGEAHFICSSWSELAAGARRQRAAMLTIDDHFLDEATLTVTFVGSLRAIRREQIDDDWIELIALETSAVALDYRGPGEPQAPRLPDDHRRYVLPAELYLSTCI